MIRAWVMITSVSGDILGNLSYIYSMTDPTLDGMIWESASSLADYMLH